MKLLSLLFLMFSLCLFAQNPEKLDIKDYVVKANFLENKFDSKYLLIGDFLPVSEGAKVKLAKVYTNTGWGYIDEKGNEIVKPVYKKITGFKHGIARGEYLENSSIKGRFIERKGIVNYKGKLINSLNYERYEFSSTEHYNKDFFLATDEKYMTGILTSEGKILIPFKYQNIAYTDHYFYADYPATDNDNMKSVDIYNKKGKLLKTIKNTFRVYDVDGQLFRTDKMISYFIDSKKFERIDQRNFSGIGATTDSGRFKIEVFYDKPNNVYETFYVDENLKIVSPDFPNATVYEDKYLIQPVFKRNEENTYNEEKPYKYVIADFKNNKIAEYDYKDFMLYQYFAHGKLDEPKYLESNKTLWSGLKKDNLYLSERWDYYKLENRMRIVRFFEENSWGRHISEGIIDAEKGNIIFKRSKEEVSEIYYLPENKLFAEKLKQKNSWKINILNSKGKFLKQVDGIEIDELSKDFIKIYRKPDTLGYQISRKYNLLNRKSFEPVFSKDVIGVSIMNNLKDKNYMFFYTEQQETGIIDNNYKIVRSSKPITGEFNSDAYTMIIKKDRNFSEIVDKNTLETIFSAEFKYGVLKKYGDQDKNGNTYPSNFSTGYYKNGFYFLNEEKNVMDRYGNIIVTPPKFDLFRD